MEHGAWASSWPESGYRDNRGYRGEITWKTLSTIRLLHVFCQQAYVQSTVLPVSCRPGGDATNLAAGEAILLLGFDNESLIKVRRN